jgi:ubiquinone/menaquinone biosynthesis C-methylase UbiE
MNRLLSIILLILFLSINVLAQKQSKPYRCGWVTKDLSQLKANYEKFGKPINVKSGEKVASAGCSNGYVEAQIAAFVDNVEWTLQDIDSTCLHEWGKVLQHHEKLKGSTISGNFILALGTEKQTKLKRDYYDRIIMLNVFHELSDKESMLVDIRGAMKHNAELVIMERMARKPNEVRKDCGHTLPIESDLIKEMNRYGYSLMQTNMTHKNSRLTFYTFKKNSVD